MPHFLPVQCHKCSVLQIKPAQKLRPKWCCSMCRRPEIKASAAPDSNVSDVSLFVEELDLPQEAEEMEAVPNTFGGVESLDGGFSWEGLYFKSAKSQEENKWKRFTGIETVRTSQKTLKVERTISRTGAVISHRTKVDLNMGNF